MKRRSFIGLLTSVSAVGLTGCSGGEATPTPTQTPSQLRGSRTEERDELVDLQYRDYIDREIEAVRTTAEDVSYQELSTNTENYVGNSITFQASILEVLQGSGYRTLMLSFDGTRENVVYGSWVSDDFETGDVVTVWGEVIGTETYLSSTRGVVTVPALTIADMELQQAMTTE